MHPLLSPNRMGIALFSIVFVTASRPLVVLGKALPTSREISRDPTAHQDDLREFRAAYYAYSKMLDDAIVNRLIEWAQSHPDDAEGQWAAASTIRQFQGLFPNRLGDVSIMLRSAAAKGFVPAWAELAITEGGGIGTAANQKAAISDLEKGLAMKDPNALFLMAQIKEQGLWGIEKDESAAIVLYREAVVAGMARGHLQASRVYWEQGDRATALTELKAGAQAGDVQAMCKLSEYLRAVQRPPDLKEAFRLVEQAAKTKYSVAERMLGEFYEDGVAVQPDLVSAAKWYEQASIGGDMDARARLGVAYCNGSGVELDPKKGGKLLQEADEGGSREAAYALGTHFMRPGSEQNLDASRAYLQRALDRGFKSAQKSLDELNKIQEQKHSQSDRE